MDECKIEKLEIYIDQLMLLYEEQVYAYALSLTRHVQDAEDITVDAYERTYLYLRSKPDGLIQQPKHWLFTTVRHIYLNTCRKQARVSVESLDFLLSPTLSEQEMAPLSIVDLDTSTQPEVAMEEQETQEEVSAQIAMLPEGVIREATALNVLSELSCPEIARYLDRPVGTIKASVHHGKVALRTSLTPWKKKVQSA